MRIVQCSITHFRGIESGTITIPDHGVVFGPNNVGKSTVIEALALALGREQMAQPLTDWDFWGGEPKPDSRATIICTISHFAQDARPEDFPDWFSGERSARPVWWDETSNAVKIDADCPKHCILAAQIAFCIRYEEDSADFEFIRYFYDGPGDPFTTDCRMVPNSVLQELGVFILPGNRQWDKLLSFGSSSFLKVLKASGAIPGSTIDKLKMELRNPQNKIEDDPSIAAVIKSAEQELQQFLMFRDKAEIAYRPTMLDSRSVMQSLIPHVLHSTFLLPFSRHGAGMNSLQAFLIVLAFAEQRKQKGKNFILIAEEPELHLHPALHARLANRIRALSQQSLVTTHSPFLASSYKPEAAIFVRNDAGILEASFLRTEPVASIQKHAIRNLYLRSRESLYSALMGSSVIIPEGESDARWLTLLQRMVESTAEEGVEGSLSIIPTLAASVVDTFEEIYRFRHDALPLIDGDPAGDSYKSRLTVLNSPPRRLVQYANETAVEGLGTWILEPCLSNPGPVLADLLTGQPATSKNLFKAICKEKSNIELQENLIWEASGNVVSLERAKSFIDDLCRIAAGEKPTNKGWAIARESRTDVYTATHICKP
jgi:hypothetical protein